MKHLVKCLLALSLSGWCHAFTPSTSFITSPAKLQSCSSPTLLYSSYDNNNNNNNDNEDSYQRALARNIQRTSIQQFLTQRSIQSFIFLAHECRDPHTADWIERFVGSPNLINFHGTGAFNLTRWDTWDRVFLDMMKEEPSKIIIQAKRRGRGRGGWSKNNPYLKDRFVEFEVLISPTDLVTRIMSVRLKLAEELKGDLDLVVKANEEILRIYNEKTMDSRDDEDDPNANQQNQIDPTNSNYYIPNKTEDLSKVKVDRTAMMMLANQNAFEMVKSSPLRKGSFDLLQLLAMHESVHRVLRQYKELGEQKSVSFQWLRDYFTERVDKYFDGSGPYDRADAFIEEMLHTPPSVKNSDDGRMMELIDPLGVAEDIIRMRSTVALDWIDILEDVHLDHSGLQKSLLSMQWGQPGSEGGLGQQQQEQQQGNNNVDPFGGGQASQAAAKTQREPGAFE